MGGITDDHVLFASGTFLSGLGVGMFADAVMQKPVLIDKAILDKPYKSVFGTTGGQCIGIAVGSLGARDIALAANKDAMPKTKRNALRVAGVTHAAWTAWCADNVRRKDFKDGTGIAAAAVHGTIAGLALWRGFRKEDSK